MNQMWFEDMMKQKFNEDICFNPTKLIILDYLSSGNAIHCTYKMKNIEEYVYEVFIDNPQIAKLHPSYIIRKLGTYGLGDIKGIVNDTLESWVRDAENGILTFTESYIYLDLDENDGEDIAKNTQKLCKMLYRKYFSGEIPKKENIFSIIGTDDKDIEEFGKSVFRNRVFEDMQYCPICEEVKNENLVAVHIVDKSMGINDDEFVDKNNGLLFCKKHASAFVNHQIEFNELGFVTKLEENSNGKGLHLSFAIRNAKRKKYLQRRLISNEE